ncbi:DUF2939 domain-containing protein [Robbsia sp. KACC 23696]|uniref:DUF2939 domain-containing protein n=1 Tax=Robbsia sp. KACC 23696 TaxID=3149231 RepID=UPI00325B4FCA
MTGNQRRGQRRISQRGASRLTVWLTATLVVLFIASVYASPWWTLSQMRRAVQARDADAFSSYVDYPALRDSVRAQMFPDAETPPSNNVLGRLGQMLGRQVGGAVVSVAVTPETVMWVMAHAQPLPGVPTPPGAPVSDAAAGAAAGSGSGKGAASTGSDESSDRDVRSDDNIVDGKPLHYAVRYRDLSTVAASVQRGDDRPVVFVFRRAGLWSWRLAGLEMVH